MLQTVEKPVQSGGIIVMKAKDLPISPSDEHVIECTTAHRKTIALDTQRLTDVFLAGMTEANEDLLAHYSAGLSSLRIKLADAASFTDTDTVERMINHVHERFLNNNRQSILSRFNSVFIENCRETVQISDDAWLAARRHCLSYDTSPVIEKLSAALSPGKEREKLLTIFMSATMNKLDGANAVRDAVKRLSISRDIEQTANIRSRISFINRAKAEHAYVAQARDAQTASIIKNGNLQNIWGDHTLHTNSGLKVEQNRIDSGRTNYAPPKGTRLGGIVAP